MAFSLLAGVARAEDPEQHETMTWGEARACEPTEFGSKLVPSNPKDTLIAAYSETGNVTAWVRLLRQGRKFLVETSVKDGMRRVERKKPRRRRIDPELAALISAQLAADVSGNTFVETTDELQIDGIWYLFTADGKQCATVPLIALNPHINTWNQVFAELFSDSASREANAWFWLEQARQLPATSPTSLAGAGPDEYVIGASSTWKHAGQEPMAILDHRANVDDDRVKIVGELANNLGSARQFAQVVATYFDANGKVLATDSTPVDFFLLPPGERTPFDFYTRVKEVSSYTLRIDAGDTEKVRPASVLVASHQEKRVMDEDLDEEKLTVTGTVHNKGNTDEKHVEICLLIYDDTGHLLDSESERVIDPLKAGTSAPFEVSIELPPGYHHYAVVVHPEYREVPLEF